MGTTEMDHALTAIIVEDDSFWMNNVTSILESEGVEVIQARSGTEVIAALNHPQETILVVDIVLPDEDGLEILTMVRSAHPNAKVLVMSGGGRLGADFYLRIARRFGANETISKPFSSDQFLLHWNHLLSLKN